MRVISWLGSLDEAARRGGLPLLDAAEHDRAGAFSDHTAGKRFATLRHVQRGLVAEALGESPDRLLSSYECPDCGPEAGHGRPGYRLVGGSSRTNGTTTPVALSASRAGEWGAVVVVTGVEPAFRIGVDLTLDEEIFDGFDDVALSGPERCWLDARPPGRRTAERAALWAAKEAVAKRDGHGLRKDPAEIAVLGADTDAGFAAGVVRLGIRGEGVPPHVLMAAVPAVAEGAFRTATA